MQHYTTLGQMSETYDTWKYSSPKYGKSNTDQSYYEPSSSRIQNSLKYGSETSAGESMTIEQAFEVPTKPNGITREELHQMYLNETHNINSDIESKNNKSLLDTTLENINKFMSDYTTQETSSQTE